MREIIFRGKRTDDGKWIVGSAILYKEPITSRTPGGSFINHYRIKTVSETYDGCMEERYEPEIIPETLGQWTGLMDKNGVKIFEGDIVKTKYGRLCIVVWFSSQVCNGWDLKTICTVENCVHTKCPDSIDLYKKENLEVLGNIHDNPELLR
jgi:uncharacterized phage protein (TIGR01671 family)